MEKIPYFVDCHPTTHSKSKSKENLSANILLFVLESSQYPCSLRPEEVALLAGFQRNYPSTCYVILRLELPQINEVKNLVVSPRFPLEVFPSCKRLVVSSYFLGWRFFSCTRPHFGSCSCGFFTGGHTTFKHFSDSTVHSCWDFNLCAAGIVKSKIVHILLFSVCRSHKTE